MSEAPIGYPTEVLDDLLASFSRDLRAADKAPRTVELYGQSVRLFAGWLTGHGRPANSESLRKHTIASWLADLADRNVSSNTLATRFAGLRRFCAWAVAEGVLPADPMAGLERPKRTAKPVPVMRDEEIARLFKACSGSSFVDRRDTAIFRVFFDTGIRISECVGLGIDEVDLDEHEVLHVLGKGRKPRVVPIGVKTVRALDRYLRIRRQHRHAHLPALWLTQRGAMSRDGLDDVIRKRATAAGVDDMHAHRFRHSLAHGWLSAGGQEQDLKRLMGWSSDAMLAVYGSSAADERAREAFRRMRLGDRL